MTDVEIPVVVAREIPKDSWLHEERFAEFRQAYAYAATQTNAIPALAALHPEELYYAYQALRRAVVRRSSLEQHDQLRSAPLSYEGAAADRIMNRVTNRPPLRGTRPPVE